MGCTIDNYCVYLEKKEDIDRFLSAFNEILSDYFYSKYSKIQKEDCNINKDEHGRLWINFEEEPLFKTVEGEEITNYFVEEYIKRYPDEKLVLSYQCSFNNCSDAFNIDYYYDPQIRNLSIKRIYGDNTGIHFCDECDADFEEALVYLEDYDENEQYLCPECGAELSLNVTIVNETKKMIF